MRIRRSAARLLGSAYSAPAAPRPEAAAPSELLTTSLPPPPPFYMEPCPAVEYRAVGGFASPDPAPGEPCELSRSPWDLIAELSLSDPQVEDDLVGKYFVSVTCRASWLFTASLPVASVNKEEDVGTGGTGTVDGTNTTSRARQKVPKKAPKKVAVSKQEVESEPKKKAKVKKEEYEEAKQPTYKCKKNDGKRWHCSRLVSRPNSLCDYHLYQKRGHLNPESVTALVEANVEVIEEEAPAPLSKPATSSKPRRKKSGRYDFGVAEGFYYYAGFGPCRSKRQCSSSMNEYIPRKKEEEGPSDEDGYPTNQQAQVAADEDTNGMMAAARDGESSCDDIARIAGVDEESSDDQYGLVSSGRHMNNGSSDGKRKKGCKRWRKPVKARSLKSLM